MIGFRLQADDVGTISIASMPIIEAVLSLRFWSHPAHYPEHAGMRTMAPAFAALDTELLLALTSCLESIPDFLTPRPDGDGETFATGVAKIRDAAPKAVAADVRATYDSRPLPPALADVDRDPAGIRDRAADALEAYWEACLAPHWPTMKAVLDADAAHRGGMTVSAGLVAMVEGLHPKLRWTDGEIVIVDAPYPDVHVEVAGRGLRMVPTLFKKDPTTYSDVTCLPVLLYPARGRGTVWLPRPEAPSAMRELVGGTRSSLLIRLAIPATTTELAQETGHAAPMVNRHLAALHRSGLLRKVRRGRSVYYSRTPIGDQLIAASQAV